MANIKPDLVLERVLTKPVLNGHEMRFLVNAVARYKTMSLLRLTLEATNMQNHTLTVIRSLKLMSYSKSRVGVRLD